MRNKILRATLVATILVLGTVGTVFAYINFNATGPDEWMDPGYKWNVSADAGSGNAVCIQWSTDDGTSWGRNECTWNGPPDDAWECTIPSNYASETIIYQFYKDIDTDDCAINGNEWEWTAQPTFDTGPNAITLTKLTGRTPILTLAAGLMLALGAIVAWRRK